MSEELKNKVLEPDSADAGRHPVVEGIKHVLGLRGLWAGITIGIILGSWMTLHFTTSFVLPLYIETIKQQMIEQRQVEPGVHAVEDEDEDEANGSRANSRLKKN